MLPGKPGDVGRSGTDNRWFVEAVRWICRTGRPWRDLPGELGHCRTAPTCTLPAGRAPACGRRCSPRWPRMPICAKRWSIRPSFAPSGMQAGPKRELVRKRSAARVGGLISKIHVITDSAWPSGERQPDRRAGQRRDAGAAAAERTAHRRADRRQGLRHRCRHRTLSGHRRARRDSTSLQPPASTSLLPQSLSAPQPDRTLLLSPTAVPPHRHPLRKAGRALR